MAYTKLPDSLIVVGNPTKHDIFSRLQINQEDFNDRIGSIEGSTAKVIIFNHLIKKPTEHKVGDVKFSFLSEVEFQNQFDDSWVLCDGRSVVGSNYQNITANSTIPDMRGQFPRVKDHGAGINPSGDLNLGVIQSDTFKEHTHSDSGHSHSITDVTHGHALENDSHTHSITDPSHGHSVTDGGHNHTLHDPQHSHGITDPTHSHHILTGAGDSGSREWPADGDDDPFTSNAYTDYTATGVTVNSASTGIYLDSSTSNMSVNSGSTGITGANSSPTGGTITSVYTGITGANSSTANIQNTGNDETRPKCITINAFIKINESSFLKRLIWKAPFDFNILGTTVNSLIAGSSGLLEIDIKKGSNLGSLSSVFTTKPSLDWSAGNYANSNNAVFGDVNVSAGDWIALDIVSFQTHQNEFHAYVLGEI